MSLTLTAALLAALPLATPETLDTITVSASRRVQPLTQALAEVTVIERAEIDASQAPDLMELLRRLPGVDFASTGGSGQSGSLFMRGGNFNHVLFLVDGIRIASANTGAAAFEHLPLDQIERIEIVRGPRASYYGSDAIGGVIAITTRERRGAAAQLRVGSYGRLAGWAALGAGDERRAFSVQVGGENYDGFSAQTPDGFSYDPDDDGYRNRNLALRGRMDLGSQQLAFSGLATRARAEFDQGVSDIDQDSVALTLEGALAERWSHRASLGSAREDLSTPVFFARFLSRREQLDWVHELDLASKQQLLFGLNTQRERGSNIDTFSGSAAYTESLRHHAAFVSWQGQRGQLDHELALRHDDHQRFGGTNTVQAALGWRFDIGRVFLSWGEGFRAPNLNELYSPGFGGLFSGNRDLDPERSRSLELGIDLHLAGFDLGINGYRTRIDDLVAFQGNETFQAINIARAAIDGVELTAARQIDAWTLGAGASWMDARDRATDLALLRRPDRKLSLDLAYEFAPGLRMAADAGYASERRDFGGDLSSYTLVGVRAEAALAGGWTLGARISNALDRDYALARGFGTAGREFLLTLRWEQGS